MRLSRKYLVAVASLAVVFGLAGIGAPMSERVSPRASSESVAHFMNPPSFDSGWEPIIDMCGHYFNVTHDLNTTEIFVDIVGMQSPNEVGGGHQRHLGGTQHVPGWSRTYGGEQMEWGRSLVETSDGGYAIAGFRVVATPTDQDFWLVKTDSVGNLQWNKTYGHAEDDAAYCVIQTSDGGYALAGYTGGYLGPDDFWLVKTDISGNWQWDEIYGGWASNDYALCLVQTSDGGYAIAGVTDSLGTDDFWLVKTDASGNMQWNQTYGGPGDEGGLAVVQAGDGGYAIAGYTDSFGAGDDDFWLVKTNSAGDIVWDQTYGGPESNAAYSIVRTDDGGYALAGYITTYAGDDDFWLVRTNSTGDIVWDHPYGTAQGDVAFCVIQSSDGGYALAGLTISVAPGDDDFWLVKTDAAGNMLWNETYGGPDWEWAHSVVETGDGGYALGGLTYSFAAGYGDFWLVKTDVEMGLAWTDSTNNTITLHRGKTDPYWNFVRVRIWTIQEPTWQFGDINQDGVVDAQDLYILSRNYGTTFSLLSLTGILAVAGIHQYQKRKQPT